VQLEILFRLSHVPYEVAYLSPVGVELCSGWKA